MAKEYVVLESNKLSDAIDELTNYYIKESEVCVGELLCHTTAPNLSIVDSVDLFAKVMDKIEHDFLIRGNVEEDWSEDVATGEQYVSATSFFKEVEE